MDSRHPNQFNLEDEEEMDTKPLKDDNSAPTSSPSWFTPKRYNTIQTFLYFQFCIAKFILVFNYFKFLGFACQCLLISGCFLKTISYVWFPRKHVNINVFIANFFRKWSEWLINELIYDTIYIYIFFFSVMQTFNHNEGKLNFVWIKVQLGLQCLLIGILCLVLFEKMKWRFLETGSCIYW